MTNKSNGTSEQGPVEQSKNPHPPALSPEGMPPIQAPSTGTSPFPQQYRAAAPVVISPEERLELSNRELKLRNLDVEARVLLAQLETLRVRRDHAAKAHMDYLMQLAEKYGFDPALTEMDSETGVIRPRQPGPGFPVPVGGYPGG